MKNLKFVLLIFHIIFLCGCLHQKDNNHVSAVTIEIIGSTTNHPYVIEINAIDEPQHMDHTLMYPNTNVYLTNQNQKAKISFEHDLLYNIKIYSTSLEFSSDPDEYDDSKHAEDLIVEIEQSFSADTEAFQIEIP
ncbi:hypothetical protein ACUL41_16735 [Virgibacillus natechei]|uniref:hypothetical protein n=1 Tax=Virgibacillus sp. CBA3643 TaxID=2942278 RepID=UPI0035A33FBA